MTCIFVNSSLWKTSIIPDDDIRRSNRVTGNPRQHSQSFLAPSIAGHVAEK
jgi:hypothetical protein